MKQSRDAKETRDFIACLGKTPEEYEQIYGVKMIIQGSHITKEHLQTRHFISILGSVGSDYSPPNSKEPEPIVIQIPETFASQMNDRCTDMQNPFGNTIKAEYRYHDNTGVIVAVVDSLDNIFFMDFYHNNSNDFEIFEWILNDFYSSNPKELYLNSFEKHIRSIDADRIEKIVITTKFDEDYFIEEGKKQIEKIIKTQQTIAKSQTEAIKRTLQTERLSVQSKIEESNKKAFLEGIKSLKSGWIVEDNRLVLKKTIPMKIFTHQGKNIKAPDGKYFTKNLSITIAPTIKHAMADKTSKHPNINGTHNVCVGDLAGKPLAEFMEKIEKTMETGNLNSPFNSIIASEGNDLFAKDADNAIVANAREEEYEPEQSRALVWNL